MQNSIDRQRLLQRYGQAPSSAGTVLAKCAAGFLILLLLLLIGLTTPDTPDAPDGEAGRQAATITTPAADDASAQHPPTAAGGAQP